MMGYCGGENHALNPVVPGGSQSRVIVPKCNSQVELKLKVPTR